MSEQAQAESAPATQNATAQATCESPPAAPMPQRDELPDPRARLLQLTAELMRSSNRRLIVEYLRLRRAIA